MRKIFFLGWMQESQKLILFSHPLLVNRTFIIFFLTNKHSFYRAFWDLQQNGMESIVLLYTLISLATQPPHHQHPSPERAVGKIDRPTLTNYYHPKFIVYSKIYFWQFIVCLDRGIMRHICNCSILQNSLTAPKVVCSTPFSPNSVLFCFFNWSIADINVPLVSSVHGDLTSLFLMLCSPHM